MDSTVVVGEVQPEVIKTITKSGRVYNSFQKGKDSIESAKQEVEFIL